MWIISRNDKQEKTGVEKNRLHSQNTKKKLQSTLKLNVFISKVNDIYRKFGRQGLVSTTGYRELTWVNSIVIIF